MMDIVEMSGINGDLPATAGHEEFYYTTRHCYIDCRGPLSISPTSYFGIGVKILTATHDLSAWPELGPMILKPVIVDDGAWIASFAILHNCHIGAHAIVSMGAVVNGMTVPAWAVVVGNPAKIVARMVDGHMAPWREEEG